MTVLPTTFNYTSHPDAARLAMTIPEDGDYCVQASPSLLNGSWTEIARHENLRSGQTLFIRDPDAIGLPMRFYRAGPATGTQR